MNILKMTGWAPTNVNSSFYCNVDAIVNDVHKGVVTLRLFPDQDVLSTNLVLQAMPATFQMHLFCVWVVETTFTQFAMEADDFAFIISNLEEVSYVNLNI